MGIAVAIVIIIFLMMVITCIGFHGVFHLAFLGLGVNAFWFEVIVSSIASAIGFYYMWEAFTAPRKERRDFLCIRCDKNIRVVNERN